MCVIINNKTFTCDLSHPGSLKLMDREGSERDKEALVRTFTKLQFDVKVFEDLPSAEMSDLLSDVADDPAHGKYDCFVCCLMSHGSQAQLYGSDGVAVPMADLAASVKAYFCRGLSGKPKLFFVQACQGYSRQRGNTACQVPEEDFMPNPDQLIPEEPDFLVGYSVVSGYTSWKVPDKGSRYIRHLTDCLNDYAHSKDIMQLHVEVNQRAGKEDADTQQAFALFTTLRKRLFLAPLARSC